MRRQLGGAEHISPKKTLFHRQKELYCCGSKIKGGTHEIFQSSESGV